MRDEAFADLGQQGIDGEDRRGHRARIRATRIRTWRGEAPNPHPALRASLSREQERGWNRAGTDYAHERASANSEDLRPHATAGGLSEATFRPRSEKRRVGKECVSTFRYSRSPDHYKKNRHVANKRITKESILQK